jgi:acetyl-CoA carboxylase biotin carboxyl carrier protein
MACIEILSPLPGTFYRRANPQSPEYKREGDQVAVGDVIGLVEVMKSFNQVQADTAGVLKSFLVENEDTVEAGQALAVIET